MARTVDLGWAIARCDSSELEIVEPESEDSPAKSITIQGWENVLALRDLLNDVEADIAASAELAANKGD